MIVTDINDLADDGDRFEMPDGTTLVVRIGSDDGEGLFYRNGRDLITTDGDWCGDFADVKHSDYIYPDARPSTMDGFARIVRLGRSGDRYWWQPPSDFKSAKGWGSAARRDESLRQLEQAIDDLYEYGYSVIVVEHRCQHDGLINAASLGGIEPFPDDAYKREVIGELLAELRDDVIECGHE